MNKISKYAMFWKRKHILEVNQFNELWSEEKNHLSFGDYLFYISPIGAVTCSLFGKRGILNIIIFLGGLIGHTFLIPIFMNFWIVFVLSVSPWILFSYIDQLGER